MFLLEHTADVYRNTVVGTNGRKQLTLHASAVECLVLPMAVSAAIENGFSIGRAYDVYFAEAADVAVGDRLVWSGNNFVVKFVQPFSVPFVGHTRALCEQEIS